MQSILRTIPLRYEHSFHGNILVNTRYIHSKIYTGVARYLLAGVGRKRGSRRAPRACSGHDVTGPDMIDLNLQDAHVGSARDGP